MHLNNEQSEKWNYENNYVLIALDTKCLGINLTKEAIDMYNKNYKTLLKEI